MGAMKNLVLAKLEELAKKTGRDMFELYIQWQLFEDDTGQDVDAFCIHTIKTNKKRKS